MKRETCKCGAMKHPHRYSHWCDMWLTTREDDALEAWDVQAEDAYNDPKGEIRATMPTWEDLHK